MKKYLGSPIDAFVAGCILVFICVPVPLTMTTLKYGVDFARILLLLGAVLCSFLYIILLLSKKCIHICSWGCFFDQSVNVKSPLKAPFEIEYGKCFGCGIGYYTHGFLNSKIIGAKYYYIFLSYDFFDESYRTRINLLTCTRTRIKIYFSPKIYNYLISVLPKKQKQMLIRDYEKYIAKGTRGQFA